MAKSRVRLPVGLKITISETTKHKLNMRIGIIVAMDSEFESIKNIIQNPSNIKIGTRTFLEGFYNNHTLVVCVGGIGKVNAAVTATLMDYCFDCTWIISTGCAGCLTTDLNVGDIVVGWDYRYHDIWCPLAPDTKRGELQGLPSVITASSIKDKFDVSKWNLHKLGHFFTGDQFIQTEDECKEILKLIDLDLDPCVCDMESMAIAHVCYQQGLHFLGFRVISDVPRNHTDANEQFKQYENFWSIMSDKSYKFLKSFLDSYIGG